MSGTPECILTARELEYLELADPVRAPKIRRLLNYEIDAANTAAELFPDAALSPGRSIPRPQELPHSQI